MRLETSERGLSRNPSWSLDCTQSPSTGYLGLLVMAIMAAALIACPLLCGDTENPIWSFGKIVIVASVFLTMAGYEIFVKRIYRRNFDFSSRRAASGPAIARRCLALLACLLIAWSILCLQSITYSSILLFFYLVLPLILIGAPIYFIVIERHALENRDELLILGEYLSAPWRQSARENSGSTASSNRRQVASLIRGVVIKSFFIPVMVISCIHWWKRWELDATAAVLALGSLQEAAIPKFLSLFFSSSVDLVLVVDVTIAMLGYLSSCRLLDTQFVSAEPTVGGWLAAMICYPPFNVLFETIALSRIDFAWPADLFARYPMPAVLFSLSATLFLAVYSWSTVVFGLRFSNLTNRGIISAGPYRLVRHPAYISKNIAWWLGLIPCVLAAGTLDPAVPCILLLLSLIYVARALTEERHLLAESHYQDYCRRVRWRFIPGLA